MKNRTVWKITICRVGTGCQIVEYDAVLKRAWRKLVHNDLNKPYVTGVNPRGERFGPDLTVGIESAFSDCKRRIWRKQDTKFVTCTHGDITVSIHRFDNVEESYEH